MPKIFKLTARLQQIHSEVEGSSDGVFKINMLGPIKNIGEPCLLLASKFNDLKENDSDEHVLMQGITRDDFTAINDMDSCEEISDLTDSAFADGNEVLEQEKVDCCAPSLLYTPIAAPNSINRSISVFLQIRQRKNPRDKPTRKEPSISNDRPYFFYGSFLFKIGPLEAAHCIQKNHCSMDCLSPGSLYPNGPPSISSFISSMSSNSASSNSTGGAGAGGGSGINFSYNGNGQLFNNNNNNIFNFSKGSNLDQDDVLGHIDLYPLEYPESPTQKWLEDNELEPLTSLDNINLKSEFSYPNLTPEIDKPPDFLGDTSVAVTRGNLGGMVQPAVTTANFMDIGTESFCQSLYDDLDQLHNLPEYRQQPSTTAASSMSAAVVAAVLNTSASQSSMTSNSQNLLQLATTSPEFTPASAMATPPVTMYNGNIEAKPITLEKVGMSPSFLNIGFSAADLARLKMAVASAKVHNGDSGINNSSPFPCNNTNTSLLNHLSCPPPPPTIDSLIKKEHYQHIDSASFANQHCFMSTPALTEPAPMIKLEELIIPDHSNPASDLLNMQQRMNSELSPLSSIGSAGLASPRGSPIALSPNGCYTQSSLDARTVSSGKMKHMSSAAANRKKSTASNSSHDEDDISSIPSLQTRIQIISQRLGIPPDCRVEMINGGHGIKNPLVSDLPDKLPIEKLPPARPHADPSKFQCRICSKIFSILRLLNRHMKCHSDTKRYLCTFCGKGFNDTFDLKRHTRTHTGVRPYKCNLCEKSFTQRCSLESHCLKVHGVTHEYDYKQRRSKMYVCEDCGHTTAEPELHYIHLKDNHPFSTALLKFNDKRHFKFSNTNFANMLLQVNS